MKTMNQNIGNKAEAFEAFDDIPTNPHLSRTIGDVINLRYGRRNVVTGMLGVAAITALSNTTLWMSARQAQALSGWWGEEDQQAEKHKTTKSDVHSRFEFDELKAGIDETHHIAEGYHADILLRWGDPIFPDAPAFDPHNQTVTAQLRQFGYNNDYVGFIPLNDEGTRGLLCVNHEYTNEEVMFPGIGRQDIKNFADMTRSLVLIEMAAHGGTIVEIAQDDQKKWRVVLESRYNRRITPLATVMELDGPAAGHDRLTASIGKKVIGTLNNCAGGITPWGTYLMAEENFHGYFLSSSREISQHPEGNSWRRYGIPAGYYAWGRFFDRFDVDKDPYEANRFGWIVEVDPMDRESIPVKHTALGRFRHEGCEVVINADRRVVAYSGDDNRFDYVYKFVSERRVSQDREANKRLLSSGTLYVARFHEDGTVDWLALIYGQDPLTPNYGFNSQAEVLIDTRLAADLLGATPMDRPEDVQPGPKGKVYIMLTNNTRRTLGQVDAANPRADNAFGHIIEITEPDEDYTATRSRWDILVTCGDPRVAEVGAQWHPKTSEHGWFASPDNCAIDAQGRLWIATDQGSNWPKTGKSDGLYALETQGALRGASKLFFRTPVGAELCGPYFTPNQETLFLAVQHPGTDGTRYYRGFERASTFEDPATRWPDFQPGMPPRPSVVVVTKKGGGKIA